MDTVLLNAWVSAGPMIMWTLVGSEAPFNKVVVGWWLCFFSKSLERRVVSFVKRERTYVKGHTFSVVQRCIDSLLVLVSREWAGWSEVVAWSTVW